MPKPPRPPKPAFVLVPGGFCPSSLYGLTDSFIRLRGYKVHAIDLPSLEPRSKEDRADHLEDAAHVRQRVIEFADDGLDVVLVGHSYGGWVINEAAKGVSKAEREAEGKKGGLIQLVYIASYLVEKTGMCIHEFFTSLSEEYGDAPALPFVTDENGYNQSPPPEISAALLAPSLPQRECTGWTERCKPMSEKANKSKLTYLGYEHIPTTMIVPTNDIVITPEKQRRSFDIAIAGGLKNLTKVEIEGDHCCQLSNPKETTRAILGAAGMPTYGFSSR